MMFKALSQWPGKSPHGRSVQLSPGDARNLMKVLGGGGESPHVSISDTTFGRLFPMLETLQLSSRHYRAGTWLPQQAGYFHAAA